MIRLATAGEEAAIDTFLSAYAEQSMFLRSNLAAHGLDGGDHPHASTYWVSETNSGITGVFGCAQNGFLMAQAPDASAGEWQAFAQAVDGRSVRGMTGDVDQVATALKAMGLSEHIQFNSVEPLYRINLDHLPQVAVEMRAPRAADRSLLQGWWADYLTDTGSVLDEAAAKRDAKVRFEAFQDGVALLIEDDAPVAMAAINAQVGHMVQVGGVFVPRDKRDRGRGRTVTAALLARARAKGARIAVLFSNNDAASRAYEAIGFRKIGTYGISLLDHPRVVGESP